MMRTPSGDKEAKTVRGSTSVGILMKQRKEKIRQKEWEKFKESLLLECFRTCGENGKKEQVI